jgi:dTMP kinase
VSAERGTLVVVDGVNGAAVSAAARAENAAAPRARRGGVSVWDASGVFEDLALADRAAGAPSARTLLLLYAADLAFRLRWEIRPTLAEGRTVVAAPYVATAVAFGRAAGLPRGWLKDLFSFAPRPDEARYVDAPPARAVAGRSGFIEFGHDQLAARPSGPTRRQLIDRARAYLHTSGGRRLWRS